MHSRVIHWTSLTFLQGVDLQLKDLVAFYIDPKQQVKNCDVVGFNVMVLKHSEHAIPDGAKPAKKAEKAKATTKKAKDATTDTAKENGKKGDRRRKLSSRKKSESSGKEDEKVGKPKVQQILVLKYRFFYGKLTIFRLLSVFLTEWQPCTELSATSLVCTRFS